MTLSCLSHKDHCQHTKDERLDGADEQLKCHDHGRGENWNHCANQGHEHHTGKHIAKQPEGE